MEQGEMKLIEDLLLEVKVLDDGAVLARRKDRKPATAGDLEQARRLADTQPGITVNDVLRVFPGSKIRHDL
jgi:hypothetical protein